MSDVTAPPGAQESEYEARTRGPADPAGPTGPVGAAEPAEPTEPAEPAMAVGGPRPGEILLAATPIGNAGDASARLRRALERADIVAAEDTRRVKALAQRLGLRIGGRTIAYHEHNEAQRTAELIEAAQSGQSVVMVSDAGMPSVSDPGYRLVVAAAEAGVPVSAAPGPSAVLTALAVSGLASDRFCFEGFLPRKPGERGRALAELADERRTIVLFESPRRAHATLQAMVEAFGPERPAALCRELTKTHEEVRRGTLAELAASTAGELLGEIVLVVAGAPRRAADPGAAAAAALALADGGMRLKEAASQAARESGLRPNEVYRHALALRQ